MDIVSFIEWAGEPQTIALAGLILAFAFGFIAERTGFCTRSAVLEIISGTPKTNLPLWLVAFGTAILLVQLLLQFNLIDVSETRFFATPLSLSGALIGGALFGIGMAFARGCPSRLLVLGGSGNLRALSTLLIIGVVALATLQGPLVPLRNFFGGFLSTNALGTNDLAVLTQTGPYTGILFAGVILIIALFFVLRTKLSALQTLGGVAIGSIIAGGWYVTYSLSTQFFEPIQAESLSFIRPAANILNYAASLGDESYLSLDIGIIIGVILAAFVASILFKSFKVQTFASNDSAPIWRYGLGGIFMGFGGILSLGCTIGAGFTGGSVLSISSLIALVSMLVFCGATEKLLTTKTG